MCIELLRREDGCSGFRCQIGCISLSQVCDYKNDCGDHRDEVGCGKFGLCIYDVRVCLCVRQPCIVVARMYLQGNVPKQNFAVAIWIASRRTTLVTENRIARMAATRKIATVYYYILYNLIDFNISLLHIFLLLIYRHHRCYCRWRSGDHAAVRSG